MTDGYFCGSVLVYEQLDISREFLLKIDYDYAAQKPKITYSTRGGMPLSLVAKRYPDTIHEIFIDVNEGLNMQSLLKVAGDLGVVNKQSFLIFLIKNMYEAFIQRDALRIEINPLIFARDQKFYAANCQIKIDPDAIFRQ